MIHVTKLDISAYYNYISFSVSFYSGHTASRSVHFAISTSMLGMSDVHVKKNLSSFFLYMLIILYEYRLCQRATPHMGFKILQHTSMGLEFFVCIVACDEGDIWLGCCFFDWCLSRL